jgi:cardiolipin synthase A/B
MRAVTAIVSLVLLSCSSDPNVDSTPVLTDDAGNPILPDGAPAPDSATHPTDGATNPTDSSTITPSSKVHVIVEPSDSGTAMVAAIKGATTSVHMTMYMLTSTDVLNALIAQKKAGHDVKVVLNQNTTQTTNQPAYDALKKANVPVVWAPATFTFTHEKCFIVDGKEAWIMTMNANREYLAVDDDATDVAQAEAIFQGDFTNKAVPAPGTLVVSPINSRPDLVGMVTNAKSTVDIEAEELSDPAFVTALGDAQKRGVKVHIVLSDAPAVPSQTQAVATLKQKGVSLVQLSTPYIHAKSMVVDGTLAFVGSENFSAGSLGYNRELGVIFSASTEVAKVQSTTTKDFAAGTPL